MINQTITGCRSEIMLKVRIILKQDWSNEIASELKRRAMRTYRFQISNAASLYFSGIRHLAIPWYHVTKKSKPRGSYTVITTNKSSKIRSSDQRVQAIGKEGCQEVQGAGGMDEDEEERGCGIRPWWRRMGG